MDLFLRFITLLVLAAWQLYWWIIAKKAYREKPLTSKKKDFVDIYIVQTIVGVPIFIQLFGVQILPMFSDLKINLLGFFVVLLGIAISVSGRIVLGTNWANSNEYQIKQKQTLTTSGIYKYIRNPIYTGMLFALTGVELVCQSYLFIVVFVIMLIWAYTRGKREEKILEEHFGKEYIEYKKRSKMLIPFIF